ncbi:YegJ family protein [Hyphococcus luteus]|nr:DUF2314 domain-containing protein [Marinicaulis flavus]
MRLMTILFLTLLLAGCGQAQVKDRTVEVATNDAAVNAAMKEARASLPQFFAKAADPQPGTEAYALKVKVEDKNGVEHFWVTPFSKTDDGFTGVINNEAAVVEKVSLGEPYAFTADEISDWMYVQNGKIHGGYTIRAMLPSMPKEEAAQYQALLADQ